jgi:ATP-binding cassette, subfamily B, bacterial MsbA
VFSIKLTLSQITDELRMYRLLFRLAELKTWLLPLLILLAALESVFEGLSLALIIPLMQTLNGGTGSNDSGFLRVLSDTAAMLPADSRLAILVGAIFAAVLVKCAVSYANMAVLAVVYGRFSHSLRVGVFKSIMAMPLAVWERERSGRHFNILDNETWRVADALYTLSAMVTNIATFLVLAILLMLLSLRLTLVALLCLALVPPLIQLINSRNARVLERSYKAGEALSKTSWTVLNGIRTIHSFGREPYETDRFIRVSDEFRHFLLRISLITSMSAPATEVTVTAIVALIALMIDSSQVAVPTLIGFLAILYRLQPRVLGMAKHHSSLAALRVPMVEVTRLLREATAYRLDSGAGAVPFAGLKEAIAFDNVTFTYQGAMVPALSHLSFRIERGRTVAIVGLSGAGKSTLLDLILRFQQPEEGTITIDAIDLNELDLLSWRERIAIVNQDPYLFDDTVRANIRYGDLKASEDRLLEAARLACADEFIRQLPNGYDTLIGERGTQISGGQRQRLSLARALIRNPDILILDEATSALDAITERELRGAFTSSSGKRTVVIVAHRLSMIEMADHAIVLEDGKLVEQGRPDFLLRSGGKLTRMFRPDPVATA